MNLAALQRFAPLLSLASKTSGELTDSDLSAVATALAGDGSAAFLPFLQKLRDSEPNQAVTEILASPTAQNLLKQMNEQTAAEQNAAFVKCPHCGRLSEVELH